MIVLIIEAEKWNARDLWLLSIALLLIMVSGEKMAEHGRLETKRKPKLG